MQRLEGKVALVTGAGGGIGAATAQKFAQEGAIVIINDMNETGGLQVAREINEAGGQAIFLHGSVADAATMEQIFREVVNRWGKIDILVNNAGVLRDAMTAKMSEEHWDIVLDTHLKGSWLCSKIALGYMKEQGDGRIINTSSVSALGNIGQANYSAAKAGIWGLTRTLALEYARYNIRVNAIAPGFIETQMTAQIPEAIREQMISRIPLRRMASPTEVANLHLFLASDESSYITGQIIFVDGGSSVGI